VNIRLIVRFFACPVRHGRYSLSETEKRAFRRRDAFRFGLGGRVESSAPSGPTFDIAIIGGGVNGCGIARDAAGRGWSVYLCEKDDLAASTSSASSKLIHGGLRYLEHFEFRLVREALIEREVLWRIAPHIVWPLRFVLPHNADLRPAWMLRIGLFLYDHLGGRRLLPPTKTLRLADDPAGEPLKPQYKLGFEYSDCWAEDARLVVLNARDAADKGAVVAPRTRCLSGAREGGFWALNVRDEESGRTSKIRARALVNAAGPWVNEILLSTLQIPPPAAVRLVKGSHIVVRRLFHHDRCYILQNKDRRVFFVIPFERDYTLIGTTDLDYKGDLDAVKISSEEIEYLCGAASSYFRAPVTADQVVWSYAGVRPLYDDGASEAQEATRDYVLKLDPAEDSAALLSIFGGKITTYRRLAEAALAILSPRLPPARKAAGWTGQDALPGGDFPTDGFETLVSETATRYPFVKRETVRRLVRAYGTRVEMLLGGARTQSDLGRTFGADLTEAEVLYLAKNEWAMSAADVVWRRSKLGLRMSESEIQDLDTYLGGLQAEPQEADRRGASVG
jgi:glycerol-3-phosphate dehydrogenase